MEYCRTNVYLLMFLVAVSINDTSLGLNDENDDQTSYEKYTRTIVAINSDENQRIRYSSDASASTSVTISKTSSELQLSSITSSYSSNINRPVTSLSLVALNSIQSLSTKLDNINLDTAKSKSGVRKFLRKIFGSSRHQDSTSIDRIHSSSLPINQGPIRLFIIRHGERLDRYYSSQWVRHAFDKDENFCRFSPILPENVPSRSSIQDFDLDPPLTYNGLKDAYHTGSILKAKNIDIHYCYSSPALRCIQTAMKILEGLHVQNRIKIRIEPGLFECTSWYATDESINLVKLPNFMTKKELLDNKYPIDKIYDERIKINDIFEYENELKYYERSHAIAAQILKLHENEFITQIQQGHISIENHLHILFVAHAPTLETCTRKLCGGKFRPNNLAYVIRNVDFLAMTVVEKKDNNCDKWIFRRNSFYGDQF